MKQNVLFVIGVILFLLSCNKQIKKKDFPLILQETTVDCGPVCLKMIGKFYGRELDLNNLKTFAKQDTLGTSLAGLSAAADSCGLKNLGIKVPFETLVEKVPLPVIVHWKQQHYVVVYRIQTDKIYIADPALGKMEYTREEFCDSWYLPGEAQGVAMVIETTDEFFRNDK